MQIKQQIIEQNEGKDIEFAEYENLILDEMVINDISAEDKAFLEMFVECKNLQFNSCKMQTIDNLPKIAKLERLELNDNEIEQVTDIFVTERPALRSLQLAQNRIKTFEMLEPLKQLPSLKSLDLEGNPVQDLPDYEATIRKMLPSLEVLDNHNKEGISVKSKDDYSEDGSEGAEDEMDDQYDEEIDDLEEGEEDLSEPDDEEGQMGKTNGDETTVEGNMGNESSSYQKSKNELSKGMIPTGYGNNNNNEQMDKKVSD